MNKSLYEYNSNLISKKLKTIRKAHKMSQEELAAKMQLLNISIDQQMISKIERNIRFVKDFELVCFCQIFKISERELLSDYYEDSKNQALD